MSEGIPLLRQGRGAVVERSRMRLGSAFAAAGLAAVLVAPSAPRADTQLSAIVASEMRQAGYPCDNPRNPQRDKAASKPGRTVWLLECDQGTFRVTVNQDGKAQVEPGN